MSEKGDRTGGKIALVEVEYDEAEEIMKNLVGAPKLCFYADARELERWRAARASDQANANASQP